MSLDGITSYSRLHYLATQRPPSLLISGLGGGLDGVVSVVFWNISDGSNRKMEGDFFGEECCSKDFIFLQEVGVPDISFSNVPQGFFVVGFALRREGLKRGGVVCFGNFAGGL